MDRFSRFFPLWKSWHNKRYTVVEKCLILMNFWILAKLKFKVNFINKWEIFKKRDFWGHFHTAWKTRKEENVFWGTWHFQWEASDEEVATEYIFDRESLLHYSTPWYTIVTTIAHHGNYRTPTHHYCTLLYTIIHYRTLSYTIVHYRTLTLQYITLHYF